MKQIFCIVAALWIAAGVSLAGPIVLDGTDSNDHGSATNGVNLDGWAYMQHVLDNLGQQIGSGVVKVLVDIGTKDGSYARSAIDSAFAGSQLPGQGWTIQHVSGAGDIDTWLTQLNTQNTGILYLTTVNETEGDMGDDELAIVNTHGQEISDFVSGAGIATRGGGLFSMANSPLTPGVQPYGWLVSLLPAATLVDLGEGGNMSFIAPMLTVDGHLAFPGLSDADLSTGPWHNYFSGDFGGLQVLATAVDDGGTARALIIGGGACASFTGNQSTDKCVTRPARYWMTHAFGTSQNCANLLDAISVSCGHFDLGFLNLPIGYHDNSNTLDAQDAVIEALGLYWRKAGFTGEIGGLQNSKDPSSRLCKSRKKMAVELVAAIANTVYLGTNPSNCAQAVNAPYPGDLIEQARSVISGEQVESIVTFTALLKKFNSSGISNNFELGLVECTPQATKDLRNLSRDPTTKVNCPGLNDTCGSAVPVVFPSSSTNFGGRAVFSSAANLSRYSDTMPSPSCGVGGFNAVWKVSPDVGVISRQFTVTTAKSNVPTVLSVASGNCAALTEVTCATGQAGTGATVVFNTDGTNTFYIIAEGANNSLGNVKIKITSP